MHQWLHTAFLSSRKKKASSHIFTPSTQSQSFKSNCSSSSLLQPSFSNCWGLPSTSVRWEVQDPQDVSSRTGSTKQAALEALSAGYHPAFFSSLQFQYPCSDLNSTFFLCFSLPIHSANKTGFSFQLLISWSATSLSEINIPYSKLPQLRY